MGNLSNRIFPEPLRSADSAAFDGTFQEIGSPIDHPAVLVKFVNNSNVLVTVSWDGVEDNDILPAGSFALYDIDANKSRECGLYIRKGTQFYVSGAAGGGNAGLVYLVVLYQG